MRRYLIIAGIALVILGIAVAAYFLFFAGGQNGLQVGSSNGSPFGSGASSTPAQIGGETGGTAGSGPSAVAGGNTAVTIAPRLVQITSGPVAHGEVVLSSQSTASSTGSVEARFVDRASGNIYSYDFTPNTLTRLTDKTLPGVQNAVWLSDGSLAYLQYEAAGTGATPHIETYGLYADGADGFFLPRDIESIGTTGGKLFMLTADDNGSAGTLAKSDGSSESTLFTTPTTALVAQDTASGTAITYSKPSASVDGYIFLVGKDGNLTRLVGPARGLAGLLSPDGKTLLFSYADADTGALRLALLDVATHIPTLLPVATFAEKCVWEADSKGAYCAVPISLATNATLPDDWYQGAVSFSDRLWHIDAANRVAELTLDFPKTANRTADMVNLAVDPKSEALVFVNKSDESLWGYDL